MITLASTSAARRRLLESAGVPVEVLAPGVDETAAKQTLLADHATPRDVADALAELKSIRVSARRPGLVIGADQTLDLDGALVDKAETLPALRETLQSLRGRSHKLHAAVVVSQDGRPVWRKLSTARLTVRDFSDVWLDAYLEACGAEVATAVGGYHLEGLGSQLFTAVEGDYFTVLGLPLLALLDFLRRTGALLS